MSYTTRPTENMVIKDIEKIESSLSFLKDTIMKGDCTNMELFNIISVLFKIGKVLHHLKG